MVNVTTKMAYIRIRHGIEQKEGRAERDAPAHFAGGLVVTQCEDPG